MHIKRTPRGSILVMSVFFMLILFITASAFLVLLPVESRAALRTEQVTQGGLVADAGVNEAMTWLRFTIDPSKNGGASLEPMNAGVYPSVNERTQEMGNGWTYRWELIPDDQTYPNGSNNIRAYTIVSRAYRNGKAYREARAEVIQETLNVYSELIDDWQDNLVKPLRSTTAPAGGPVHINDVLRMWIPEGNGFWTSGGDPIFDHGLTASGAANNSLDGFLYYQGNWNGNDSNKRPYNNSGPIESRYERMAEGGRDNVRAGAADVPLPENTFRLRDAAWGFNQNNIPNNTGVHVNEVNGKVQGIYIEGDVEEMQLGFGGSEPAGSNSVYYGQNSWVKIEQPGNGTNSIDDNENYTVITVDSDPVTLPSGTELNGVTLSSPTTLPVGSTLMREPDGSGGETFSSWNSELNGVVFANGDIRDLWGINKGRRTIAVAGEANSTSSDDHTIWIGGREDDSNNNPNSPLSTAQGEKGLIQFGVTDNNNDGVLDPPTTAENVLGIIAPDVYVSDRLKEWDRWDNPHSETNPLYLYATILGGLTGDGGTYAVEDHDDGGAGWVYRYGSRIMVDAGAWGTTSGHGLINGNTFFDEPASTNPPPYFPTKPSFVVKSYYERPMMGNETI